MTALLLTSSSRAKSLIRIFSKSVLSSWFSVLKKLLLAFVRLFPVHMYFSRIGLAGRRRIFYAFDRVSFERLAGIGKVANAIGRLGSDFG